MEPQALSMLGKFSTASPHPHPFRGFDLCMLFLPLNPNLPEPAGFPRLSDWSVFLPPFRDPPHSLKLQEFLAGFFSF